MARCHRHCLPRADGPGVRPSPPAIARVRRRRRPSGEPPALPRQLRTSGKWWLGLSAAVVVAWVVVVVTGTIRYFDVADTRVLQAFAELRSPLGIDIAEVAGVLATERALHAMWLTNLVLLVAFRRWRHLFVWFGVSWSWSTSPRSWPRRCSGRAPSRWSCSARGRASRCRRCP